MQKRFVKVHTLDNVACLLEDASKGDTILVDGEEITLAEDIEFAHKVCIRDLPKDSPVIKYGEEIGYMLQDASKGSWIHMHNMDCVRGKK